MRILLTIIVLLLANALAYGDSFDQIKSNLAQSGCHQIEFINIIESDVFETIDSTFGNLLISSDKQYKLSIAEDVFLADSSYTYDYSAENNQVIIEKRLFGNFDEISFITRLEDLYQTQTIEPNLKYYLKKRPEVEGDTPDSMTIWIDSESMSLKQIKYFDVNEDLNRVIILKQDYLEKCDPEAFYPDFPEDAERIKL